VEYKDYYQILGVDKTATVDELKKAYRKLARKYHPDISKEADAEVRMKEVNEAYEVLKDPEKRAAYDQLGSGWRQGQDFNPPPGWDAGFEFSGGFADSDADGFSDFFSSLFGQRFRQPGQGRHQGQARGKDHNAKVLIDLEDAFHGATRTISLRLPEVGSNGHMQVKERTLNVKIPKGVKDGQHIRLSGMGAPGSGGGKAGDLYLEVSFNPHRMYRVEGHDLHITLPIAPWEAALGATVKTPTPNGNVEVRIPAGSQTGKKLRLKGRGIPYKPPGDLYLELEIVTPEASTDRARELYQNMAKEMPFNPRKSLGA